MTQDHLYFGCGDRAGHYWHVPGEHPVTYGVAYDNRTKYQPAGCPYDWNIDGGAQPNTEQPNRARLEHHDGWTCLAWWDRTVDTRPGSCSAFVARGTHDYTSMLALLTEKFPWVARRSPKLDLVDEHPRKRSR